MLSGSGSEVVFLPPGCDPFDTAPVPKTHYHPSNLLLQSSDLQNAVLTPEKPHKPSTRDNSCYSPINYSFSEEDRVKFFEKPQLGKDLTSIHSDKSSKLFYEQWPCTDREYSTFKESTVQSRPDIPTTALDSRKVFSDKVETINIFNDQLEVSSGSFMKPKMSSTQRSSQPRTDFSSLVNQFRYGKPLPPSERKRLGSSSMLSSKPPSSVSGSRPPSVNKKTFGWQSQESKTSSQKSSLNLAPSTTVPEPYPSSSETLNDSFAELHQRVETILKDSTLALSSHQSNSSSSVGSFSIAKPADFTGLPPTEASSVSLNQKKISFGNESTASRSLFPSAIASSSNIDSTSSIPEPNHSIPKPETRNHFPSPAVSQPTPQLQHYREHELSDSSIAPPKRFHPVLHEDQRTSSHIPFKSDILQQWRLRRKMEAARSGPSPYLQSEAVRIPETFSKPTLDPPPQQRYPPAERPFDSSMHPKLPLYLTPITKETRSVGISAVPGVCVQTQTSPPSSPKTSDGSHSSSVEVASAPRVEKYAGVSVHRVTVVTSKADESAEVPPSPVSDRSVHASTDTWSDLHSSKYQDTLSQTSSAKIILQETQAKVASPTTAVVKEVVGARLFNASHEASPTEPIAMSQDYDDTFQSCTDEEASSRHSVLLESNAKPISSTTERTYEKDNREPSENSFQEDPNIMLESLLSTIASEEEDFPDDPVLKSLRQQRDGYLSELRIIEEKLKEKQGLEDDNITVRHS